MSAFVTCGHPCESRHAARVAHASIPAGMTERHWRANFAVTHNAAFARLCPRRAIMRRRNVIALLAGAAAWPLAARAQEIPRRLGVLMAYADDDAEGLARLAAFKQTLGNLGWLDGRNLQIEVRWSAGDIRRASVLARELVALQPAVILANATPSTAAVQRETRSIPVVFVPASDPIGSGFVKSLAHPGGNITGFINLESTLIQKWLELLKEIAPQVTRAAIIFNPQTAPYADYYLRSLPAAAERLGVARSPLRRAANPR
jgi:putative tryptophan/tyrosine transport system substrate-binding protein